MASKTRIEKYRRDLDDILQVQELGVLEKVKAWLIPVMNDKVDVTRDILSYLDSCVDKMVDASLKMSIYLSVQVQSLLKMVKLLKQKGKCIELSEKFIDLSENLYKISKKSMAHHGFAITCAIMAPACQERSQLLTTLYQDQRNKLLPKEYLSVMEKVLQERLIKQTELVFLVLIESMTSDFRNAILEHNLLVASKLYTSVKLQKLAKLLEMEPELFEEDRICISITTSSETVVHFGTRQPPAAAPASSSGVSEAGTEVAGASSMICWSCHSADGGPGGLFRCRGCKRARYCDPECQAADWKRHQAYCVQKQGQREASKAEINSATDLA